jgi:integrase
VPEGLVITTTFGTSHGPTQPLIVNWTRFSSPRFRHSLLSHSTGTSGRAPSATSFFLLRTSPRPRRADQSLLAVGGVPYEKSGLKQSAVTRGFNDTGLSDLPSSEDEARAAVDALPNRMNTLLVGNNATETAFKKATNHGMMHLAVHAIANEARPDRAALVLLSDPPNGEDGFLQTSEIVQLPLNADLIVLSAWVLLDFGTGLRRGELSGVRWEDIYFDDKVLIPKRSIVKQRIGKVKTEASKKSIPLDDVLIEELLAWRRETPYSEDSDYVFASTKMRGKQPYWMSRIMQHHIKPVAAKTGIEIKGWHTLRHSYTTLLRQNNNNPKVVQGLLRHASYSITMNVYDEAMSEEKRSAHRGVIQQLNRSVTRSAPKPAIPQVVEKVGVPDGI